MEQRTNEQPNNETDEHAEGDKRDQVTISVYHVCDESDVHRFIATNSRFIQLIGGEEALEQRLRDQFRAFELIGTCAVGGEYAAGQFIVDPTADAKIAEKIKAIAREHPNCDPCPQPWSEGEQRKDMARSIADSLKCSSELERKIVADLLKILASTTNTSVVIALIHHRGALRAAVVLHDSVHAGLSFHDGGEPAKVSMTAIPDPDRNASRWVVISTTELKVRDIACDATEPIAYLVMRMDGSSGVALAPKKLGGRIGWIGSSEPIDQIAKILADAGLLTIKV